MPHTSTSWQLPKQLFSSMRDFIKLSNRYFLFHDPPDTNISSIEWTWNRLFQENSFISHPHLSFRVACGKSMISYLSLRTLQSCCHGLENLFLMDISFATYCTAGAVFQFTKLRYQSSPPQICFSGYTFCSWDSERATSILMSENAMYLYISTCTHTQIYMDIYRNIDIYNVKHNPVAIPKWKIFWQLTITLLKNPEML